MSSSWSATVLTLFPEMFPGPLGVSLLGKALTNNLWSLDVRDIRDHGIGVEPADVPLLFTPFFRTDRSRARSTGGVGLGLALAKRIVEKHGGRIALASAPSTLQVVERKIRPVERWMHRLEGLTHRAGEMVLAVRR